MAAIKLKSYSKTFAGRVVHSNINLEIEKGECLGLIGGSGVGKSVILRSLIGLERADSGEIWIENEEISKFSEDELIPIRKKVAYVFQNGALFDSMSVYENLAYPLRAHTDLNETEIQKRIYEQLEEFGLGEAAEKFPSQLSGGMQKRVGLARSIILRPEIVLYDEPTAGLDPFNTLKIQEMILRMKAKGVTSIFVTHDMPSVTNVCDRVALIVGGEIVAVESVRQMKTNSASILNKFAKGEMR